MTIAVDSNILLDIVTPSSPFAAEALSSLETASWQGPLIISDVVYAEISVGFRSAPEVGDFLEASGVYVIPASREALYHAGQSWIQYLRRRPSGLVCPRCGTRAGGNCASCGTTLIVRQHLVADFMIGAHALHHADGLLTRDKGIFGTYFPELRLA